MIKEDTPVLSELDLRRLMAAQILSGLVANRRRSKQAIERLTVQAIIQAARIIDLTEDL